MGSVRSTSRSRSRGDAPTVPPPELVGEDLLSISEASDLTGVPRSTMALWVRRGRFPRATVLQLGKVRAAWYVPITDLMAAGLVSRRKAEKAPAPRQQRDAIAKLERQLAALRDDAQRLRDDNERLEILRREHESIIADLRRRLAIRGRSGGRPSGG